MLGATIAFLDRRAGQLREAAFLASTGSELQACLQVFDAHPRLQRDASTA
jgi:hypothetical protein